MSNKDQFDAGTPPADGDKNYGGVLIGINWAVFVPANVFVALRVYTRVMISHNLGWDDAMIVLAQAVNCVGMGFVMLEVHYGLGRHKYYLDPDHYVGFLEYNFLDWNQVILTLCLSKIAICMFLLRLSRFAKWRNFLYGMIAFLVVSHLPLQLLFLLQCIPVQKAWNQDVPGKCSSLEAVENIIIVQGVFSILTDVILAAFPILLLWNMRLPKRQKIQLNCLLGLGIITAFACIIRTIFSYEVKQPDLTWQGVPNALCRMIEINTGITAACMPMMRTLLISFKKRRSQRESERQTYSQTAPSQLQFYTPPAQTPWYLRVKRSLRNRPPAMDMAQDIHASHSDDHSLSKSDLNIEKISKPQALHSQRSRIPTLSPKTKTPPIPRHYHHPTPPPPPHTYPPLKRHKSRNNDNNDKIKDDRPENATWAKDDHLSRSDSIDLPIQGPRKKGWVDPDANPEAYNEDERRGREREREEPPFGLGSYSYHRPWV